MCLSNCTALHSAVSVPVATVLCQGVACLVIKVEVDGGRVVTLACDLIIVDGFGGLDTSMRGTRKGGASGGWVKQQAPCVEGKELRCEEHERRKSQDDVWPSGGLGGLRRSRGM